MTVKGGVSPACAACKFQRRKCTPNCTLAQYFPANQAKTFLSVHRLFGVSNITKILRSLESEDHRDDAMKSIIYEAEMRQRFPVYGCSVVISQLRYQLVNAFEELKLVHAQLDVCRSSAQAQQQQSDYFHDAFDHPAAKLVFNDSRGGNSVDQFINYSPFDEKGSVGGLKFELICDDRHSSIEIGRVCESTTSESSSSKSRVPRLPFTVEQMECCFDLEDARGELQLRRKESKKKETGQYMDITKFRDPRCCAIQQFHSFEPEKSILTS